MHKILVKVDTKDLKLEQNFSKCYQKAQMIPGKNDEPDEIKAKVNFANR